MENTSIGASLSFVGDEFDTNYVTQILDKKPDYILTKGELIKSTGRLSSVTVWEIRIAQKESMDIDTHMIPIFDFIEQNIEILQSLSSELDSEWRISVHIIIRNGKSPGMFLAPKQIELASAINAGIDFDLYAW